MTRKVKMNSKKRVSVFKVRMVTTYHNTGDNARAPRRIDFRISSGLICAKQKLRQSIRNSAGAEPKPRQSCC